MRTVDYGFYTGTYHGTLTAEKFSAQIMPAAAYVDALTMGRAAGADLTERELLRVQLAICAAVDAMDLNQAHGDVVSESNDGVSVHYESGASGIREKQIRDAAVLYLAQTNLLYRGVG